MSKKRRLEAVRATFVPVILTLRVAPAGPSSLLAVAVQAMVQDTHVSAAAENRECPYHRQS